MGSKQSKPKYRTPKVLAPEDDINEALELPKLAIQYQSRSHRATAARIVTKNGATVK